MSVLCRDDRDTARVIRFDGYAYHAVKPEFSCALSILATVVSCRPNYFVLDAGSKAISKDFGMPVVKGRPQDRVDKLSEEHTKVESADHGLALATALPWCRRMGCATMNLHRQCVAIRKGRIEGIWPIEASGRYD